MREDKKKKKDVRGEGKARVIERIGKKGLEE